MNFLARTTIAAALLLAAAAASAQESRQMNRIATPQSALRLPQGARAVAAIRPISRERIEAAVQQLAQAWNTPRLPAYLAPNFYGKDRLVDTLASEVPKDAKLRVLSIQGVQTLGQYVQAREGAGDVMVSRVSVTARTQVEFNDPKAGLKRLDGTNEFILQVTEPGP